MRIRAVKRVEAGELPEDVIRTLIVESTYLRMVGRLSRGGIEALCAKAAPGRPTKLSCEAVHFVYQTVTTKRNNRGIGVNCSSFLATTTGGYNSPTKNTRELSTTVDMLDGDVIVLGGLVQDGDSYPRNSHGWFPKFLDDVSLSKAWTEALLLL
jgi:hypothetical protein